MPSEQSQIPLSNRSSSAGVILLVVLFAITGLRFAVVSPVRNYQLDFRAYYAAGRALHQGVNPYDRPAVREAVALPGKQSIVPYVYPPPTLAVASIFARLPYPAAQVPWAIMQFGLGLGAMLLLWRALGVEFGSPTSVLVAAAFLLSSSVAELFRWGQFDLIVVVLLAGAVLALVRGQSVWAGVLIGLAAVAKVTPAAYLGIFLLRRDYKGLVAGMVVICASMLAAWVVLPGGVYEQWLSNLSRLSADVNANNMSLRGVLLSTLVGGGEQAPAFTLSAKLVVALCWGIIVLLVGVTVYWLVRHRAR
ncbi:MAG: glycosyltransferase family 87 protein, partial [Planctomycetota bacterium]